MSYPIDSDIELRELDRLAEDHGLEPMPISYHRERSEANSILTASGMLAIVALLAGPQPRYRTKWAQLWVLVHLPFGVGILWWLATDAPWSRQASALPEPLPHQQERALSGGDRRITGGRSFVTMFFLGLLIAATAHLAIHEFR